MNPHPLSVKQKSIKKSSDLYPILTGTLILCFDCYCIFKVPGVVEALGRRISQNMEQNVQRASTAGSYTPLQARQVSKAEILTLFLNH
jgi:hypothetical protein